MVLLRKGGIAEKKVVLLRKGGITEKRWYY